MIYQNINTTILSPWTLYRWEECHTKASLNKLRAKMEEISGNMNPEDEWDYGYKAGVEDLMQFLDQDLKEPKAESEKNEEL